MTALTKGERFDVAVVGAGAAGCVAAARLAEGGHRSVILLEAGPDLRRRMPEQMRNGWGLFEESWTGVTNHNPTRLLVYCPCAGTKWSGARPG